MPSVSRRRPRALRLSPDERRASLVEAGIHVVARRGIEAARPAEVAAEAGVSEATIYVYFANREAMVAAVLDEVGRFYLAVTKVALETNFPLSDRLAAALEALAASVETHPDHARVWFNWGSSIRGRVWIRFLETEGRITQLIAEAVRSAPESERAGVSLHPDDLARLTARVAEGIARMIFADLPPREIRRFIRSTLAMLFPSR